MGMAWIANVRIISDEGGFFGSGRKLEDIYISTPYSENAENKILKLLTNTLNYQMIMVVKTFIGALRVLIKVQ